MSRSGGSVVICCYTAARWERLHAAIWGTVDQLGDDDELIVVVDHNGELLGRLEEEMGGTARILPNRYEPGLSGARNTGVEAATKPIVLFLDDDATPTETWVDDLLGPFADEDVVGVGGKADPDWATGSPPWWLPEEFYWVVGCSYRGLPEEKAEVRNPIGCNMAFRRDALDSVSGFSAELGRVEATPAGAEETELSIRIRSATGGKIIYEPAALVNHAVGEERTTVGYFSRRCYAEGKSKAIMARRVGVGDATEAERRYLRTLLTGVFSRAAASVRQRRMQPLGQIIFLGMGLMITTVGFVLGTATEWRRRRR